MTFTFVYAHPEDALYVEGICDTIERFNGSITLVQLACDQSTIEQRATSPGRDLIGKISSADRIRQLMQRHDLLSPVPGRESLTIDNTTLAPDEVARRIVDHFGLATKHTVPKGDI